MNLLNIQLPKNNFHNLIQLSTLKEHNVYSNWHGSTTYENSFGIYTLTEEDNSFLNSGLYVDPAAKDIPTNDDIIDYVQKFIDYYNIDILLVTDPNAAFLYTHFHNKIKYIGPPEKVARLETDKLYSKEIANNLNIKTPKVLKEGKYSDDDYGCSLNYPAIEKPSHTWGPAVNLFTEKDSKRAIELRDKNQYPRDIDTDYYIEEYICDMIETNVFFVIANGEYRITHTQQIIGENENKTIDGKVWYIGSYIKPLKPEVDIIVREQANIYLKEIAKMGGSYEGSFCGAYTSTGEWYFLEINVRPDIYNSTPTFMTGDNYIKGMFDDISLFEKAWDGIQCDKLLITTLNVDEEYPIHLHSKYDVALPNNLEIKDGKYYVSLFGTDRLKGCGTIIADHNISKEFVKEIEETTHWKFNEDPNP